MESQLIQVKVRWLVELVREWRSHSLSFSKKKRSKMFFPVKKLTVSFKGLLNFWNCITFWVYFRIVSVFKETKLKLEQHYLQFPKPSADFHMVSLFHNVLSLQSFQKHFCKENSFGLAIYYKIAANRNNNSHQSCIWNCVDVQHNAISTIHSRRQ